MAEGIFRHIAAQRGFSDHFGIDSAGLGSWHVGRPPDARAQDALRSMNIDISSQRARRISSEDFEHFDLVLAMDRSNRNGLMKLAPPEHHNKVKLLLSFTPNLPVQEIPDPFLGGADSVDYVCQLVDSACRGLLVSLTTPAEFQANPAANPSLSVPANG